MYDIDDIKLRVENAKRELYVRSLVSTFLLVLAILAIILKPETTVIFVSVLAGIIVAIIYIRYLSRHPLSVVFSKELRGKNVKEDEYVISGSTRVTRWGGIMYSYSRARRRGDVYLHLENGDYTMITRLPQPLLDIYDIGDTLVRYAGTRYPVVLDRDAPRMPCPICAEINESGRESCRGCGLKMIPRKK